MTGKRQRQGLRQGVLFATGLLAWALLPLTSALAGGLPATGQTTAYKARNNGDAVPVSVPDDGTLQRGKTLRYKLLKDGTIEDKNTGLNWEVKCSNCGGLHDVVGIDVWSGDGSEETIWDWLNQINAEGGKGYAGHNDWRIPNLRELQSIVDYERVGPSIDPIFGPTVSNFYWSSTTYADDPAQAWLVGFLFGDFDANGKDALLFVRAVRGGPK